KQKAAKEGSGVAMDIQSDRNYEENTQEKEKCDTPPISNLIQLHSVVTDIKKQKADITFGKLFQAVPKLRSELSRNSGAAGSIVSKGLLDKLGMKVSQKSSAVITNVNGQKTSPLGE
ncbi:2602_t:CDS:2, partial [Entrophospora sp. SA101]